MNSISYNGSSCRYDAAAGVYSRPAVSIKYPCSNCGSNRPLKKGSLEPDQCGCTKVKPVIDLPKLKKWVNEESMRAYPKLWWL